MPYSIDLLNTETHSDLDSINHKGINEFNQKYIQLANKLKTICKVGYIYERSVKANHSKKIEKKKRNKLVKVGDEESFNLKIERNSPKEEKIKDLNKKLLQNLIKFQVVMLVTGKICSDVASDLDKKINKKLNKEYENASKVINKFILNLVEKITQNEYEKKYLIINSKIDALNFINKKFEIRQDKINNVGDKGLLITYLNDKTKFEQIKSAKELFNHAKESIDKQIESDRMQLIISIFSKFKEYQKLDDNDLAALLLLKNNKNYGARSQFKCLLENIYINCKNYQKTNVISKFLSFFNQKNKSIGLFLKDIQDKINEDPLKYGIDSLKNYTLDNDTAPEIKLAKNYKNCQKDDDMYVNRRKSLVSLIGNKDNDSELINVAEERINKLEESVKLFEKVFNKELEDKNNKFNQNLSESKKAYKIKKLGLNIKKLTNKLFKLAKENNKSVKKQTKSFAKIRNKTNTLSRDINNIKNSEKENLESEINSLSKNVEIYEKYINTYIECEDLLKKINALNIKQLSNNQITKFEKQIQDYNCSFKECIKCKLLENKRENARKVTANLTQAINRRRIELNKLLLPKTQLKANQQNNNSKEIDNSMSLKAIEIKFHKNIKMLGLSEVVDINGISFATMSAVNENISSLRRVHESIIDLENYSKSKQDIKCKKKKVALAIALMLGGLALTAIGGITIASTFGLTTPGVLGVMTAYCTAAFAKIGISSVLATTIVGGKLVAIGSTGIVVGASSINKVTLKSNKGQAASKLAEAAKEQLKTYVITGKSFVLDQFKQKNDKNIAILSSNNKTVKIIKSLFTAMAAIPTVLYGLYQNYKSKKAKEGSKFLFYSSKTKGQNLAEGLVNAQCIFLKNHQQYEADQDKLLKHSA
ncbi:MAG: hypothetical protein EP298_00040 [Gammaproteobacteria bacterium]|nr:MAG: hypothetical protein EP298_00040 [Gammaproteobacteria bacterium]UTW43227.1 hypothetical protein KFE69_03535 [bacterium SCSIO 12844]